VDKTASKDPALSRASIRPGAFLRRQTHIYAAGTSGMFTPSEALGARFCAMLDGLFSQNFM